MIKLKMANPRKNKKLLSFWLQQEELDELKAYENPFDIDEMDIKKVGDIILTAIMRGDMIE